MHQRYIKNSNLLEKLEKLEKYFLQLIHSI